MAARFVPVDHDTPLLLPPDLRQWVPADHLVHFLMDAVGELDLSAAKVNERGTGDAQYPPRMMLGLLIYSYATGVFSSRQIERTTHDSVAVRLLCADTHPDHDTICAFRKGNGALLQGSFAQVIELAARCGVLQVGGITVAIDGSKVLASASKHAAVSYEHAGARMQELDLEIAQLVAKAEEADSTPLGDGLSVPQEIERRQQRKARLAAARAEMAARAAVRAAAERVEYERHEATRAARQAAGQKRLGRKPKPPEDGPGASDQMNFTDPQSRIMKAGSGDHFAQAYNAQAAVEVQSRLIVGQRVSNAPTDKQQLLPTLAAVVVPAGPVAQVLVDSGYFSEAAIRQVEQPKPGQPLGTQVLSALHRQGHGRSVTQLEKRTDPPPPDPQASFVEHMAHRVATAEGRARYRLRQQTVEPVFGIIKEALGFRRFSLRGLAEVGLEWTLVTLAYNLRRLHRLGTNLAMA
jgi:transposase